MRTDIIEVYEWRKGFRKGDVSTVLVTRKKVGNVLLVQFRLFRKKKR